MPNRPKFDENEQKLQRTDVNRDINQEKGIESVLFQLN